MTQSTSAPIPAIDCERETQRIVGAVRQHILQSFHKRGVVIGLSGGIDSSVTAALCVRALGAGRVFGLLTPERESSGDSSTLAYVLAAKLGIETCHEDITPILEAAGCYRRRDEAVASVVPSFGPGHTCKLSLPPLAGNRYRLYSIVVRSPSGETQTKRLPHQAYLAVVAATNFKQRVRKMMEYYHADRLNYAVAGTPNRLEYDQGFFVKQGDGAADIKPIAHLYKSQVYELAAYLEIPDEIRMRPPTTDTYSMAQSQEEFFFSVPYHVLDACMHARDAGASAEDTAAALGIAPETVASVFEDIDAKRNAARYLHAAPFVIRD